MTVEERLEKVERELAKVKRRNGRFLIAGAGALVCVAVLVLALTSTLKATRQDVAWCEAEIARLSASQSVTAEQLTAEIARLSASQSVTAELLTTELAGQAARESLTAEQATARQWKTVLHIRDYFERRDRRMTFKRPWRIRCKTGGNAQLYVRLAYADGQYSRQAPSLGSTNPNATAAEHERTRKEWTRHVTPIMSLEGIAEETSDVMEPGEYWLMIDHAVSTVQNVRGIMEMWVEEQDGAETGPTSQAERITPAETRISVQAQTEEVTQGPTDEKSRRILLQQSSLKSHRLSLRLQNVKTAVRKAEARLSWLKKNPFERVKQKDQVRCGTCGGDGKITTRSDAGTIHNRCKRCGGDGTYTKSSTSLRARDITGASSELRKLRQTLNSVTQEYNAAKSLTEELRKQ